MTNLTFGGRLLATMTEEERQRWAEMVANAIIDGGPGPGADFLTRLRAETGLTAGSLIAALIPGVNPDRFVKELWDRERQS